MGGGTARAVVETQEPEVSRSTGRLMRISVSSGKVRVDLFVVHTVAWLRSNSPKALKAPVLLLFSRGALC